ncbi:MAG TPA: ribonuclease H-like domain-containing protein [Vicinamibacterales bacterium]|nr:ribonuclease H-like domain-containing protein [Vicinamibacterales bacterium]
MPGDLASRLRSIVRPAGARDLTYEPEPVRYDAAIDLDRVAHVLGGRVATNAFGRALVIDRRYESDRRHGRLWIGDCELADAEPLRILDGSLRDPDGAGSRILFVDLETTGLSGGAGTVAFLVGCAWFDMGALQVRQFLLTSYAAERALLCAAAECLDEAALLVTYNGKTFDVPVMETRWMFHRMEMPLEGVRHFDMLHVARRLWRERARADDPDGGCRLSTLERLLFDVRRVGDVPGMDIPARYFRFLRSGDARPLEPILEHNRLDLMSLAAVAAHAARLVEQGSALCRDAAEALALGRVYDRGGRATNAIECYERAAAEGSTEVRAEALYRLAVRLRRDRRFDEAANVWRQLLDVRPARGRSGRLLTELRHVAAEALAIHHEHRARDYAGARELALLALEEANNGELDLVKVRTKTDATRRRLARLERKLAANDNTHLFGGCVEGT